MKRLCDVRKQILTLLISLTGIVCCSFIAAAAQEPYDIDLKELRRPPVRHTKKPLPPDVLNETASETKQRENSSYVVQSGDHLFLS